MHGSWSDTQAQAAIEQWGTGPHSNRDLALRVYTSRLIGQDQSLVLHGGGNTSVKTQLRDDTDELVDVLCVKGSGWDLATIEPRGLPALRLHALQRLRTRDSLSDEAMVNAARIRMLDASGPNPSVETLLHAFLPHKFIDHSHADAILALVDQPDAATLCRKVFGTTLAVVPYIMPGFTLAKAAAEIYEAHPRAEGLLLLQHGLFTWGDDARTSYERHLHAIARAREYIAQARSEPTGRPTAASTPQATPAMPWTELAPMLRGRLGTESTRFILQLRDGPHIRAFVDSPNLRELAGRGPATPDHVIRTKPLPLILDPGKLVQDPGAYLDECFETYRRDYTGYVEEQIRATGQARTMLDPDPRVILIPGLGLVGVGSTPAAASIAADLYEHTIDIITDAQTVGCYQALPPGDLFAMEYWSLEQAKLGVRQPKSLAGQVVLITGAASGIGAATAEAMAEAGAYLWLVDRDAEGLTQIAARLGAGWDVLDVTDQAAVQRTVELAVACYGGLDGLVSNAGTAPQAPIDRCAPEIFDASLAVNLLSHQSFAKATTAVLQRQGRGGFLLFNASKSAFNPGPDFGPYAVAKAGLIALMRQYAVEQGAYGIRSNAINADRIRTHLLDPTGVEARARARGLTADAYYRSNLLGAEVTAAHVAQAMVALAVAQRTTGAVLPVDGGNIAAAPR